jgi:hypothetical protein
VGGPALRRFFLQLAPDGNIGGADEIERAGSFRISKLLILKCREVEEVVHIGIDSTN